MFVAVPLVFFIAFSSGFLLCATVGSALCIWNERHTTERLFSLTHQLGMALGELHGIKNQKIVHLTGRERVLCGLLGSIERHLFLEYRDGNLNRVVGETNDLSIFPDLTPEQISAIASLLAKAVKVVGKVAGKIGGGCASLSN